MAAWPLMGISGVGKDAEHVAEYTVKMLFITEPDIICISCSEGMQFKGTSTVKNLIPHTDRNI